MKCVRCVAVGTGKESCDKPQLRKPEVSPDVVAEQERVEVKGAGPKDRPSSDAPKGVQPLDACYVLTQRVLGGGIRRVPVCERHAAMEAKGWKPWRHLDLLPLDLSIDSTNALARIDRTVRIPMAPGVVTFFRERQ